MVSTRLLFLSRSSWTSGEWGGWQFCSSCNTALWARTAQCNAVKPDLKEKSYHEGKKEYRIIDKGASIPVKPSDGSLFLSDSDCFQAAHQQKGEVAAYCELSVSRWWKNPFLIYLFTKYTLERVVLWKRGPNKNSKDSGFCTQWHNRGSPVF